MYVEFLHKYFGTIPAAPICLATTDQRRNQLRHRATAPSTKG